MPLASGPSRRAILAGVAAVPLSAMTATRGPSGPRVLELRQYKIVHGRRDEMVGLFEREFVDSQNAIGMRIVGTFRDLDDPDRFTWIREFPSMAERATDLGSFYYGPVWAANRDQANRLLDDNDNVLLLRAAWTGSDFPAGPYARPTEGVVGASIHYLWKDPAAGFAAFFRDEIAPKAAAAGLPVVAAFIPVTEPNNFPRLPVRAGEKVFVWFCRAPDARRLHARMEEMRRLLEPEAAARLAGLEERAPQVLALAPTTRSAFR